MRKLIKTKKSQSVCETSVVDYRYPDDELYLLASQLDAAQIPWLWFDRLQVKGSSVCSDRILASISIKEYPMSGVTSTDTMTGIVNEDTQVLQQNMSSDMFGIMAAQFQNAISDISSSFSDDSSDPDAVD